MIGKRFRRLGDLIEVAGNLRDLPWDQVGPVWDATRSVLEQLPQADTPVEYQALAITILRPIAGLTANEFDDTALLALEILARDPAWGEQLDMLMQTERELPDDIPEDAVILTMRSGPEVVPADWAQATVEPLPLIGGPTLWAKVIAYLPTVIHLIRELRRLKGAAPQPLAA